VKKAPKAKVVEHLLKTPSKGIGATNFYASPAKVDSLKPPSINEGTPTKSIQSTSSISPTKKFSKSANKTLTEMDILENLNLDEEFENKTPEDAKKPPKTFKTEIPAEKTKNQRKTIEIKSPIVVAKIGKRSKIPVKSPPAKNEEKATNKSSAASKLIKTPKKNTKIPVKSPPAKNEEKATTKSSAASKLIKTPKKNTKIPVKSPPAKNEEKAATKASAASKLIKTPKKNTKVSAKDLPPGSPALNKLFKDIKKVEIKLTPLKIKEDRNLIFELLEENYHEKERVEKVVEAIKQMKEDSSPRTRLSDSVVEVSPVKSEKKSSKKKVGRPKSVAKSVKNSDASPKLKERRATRTTVKNDKVKENILEAVMVKTPENEKAKKSAPNSKELKPKKIVEAKEPKVGEKKPKEPVVKETKATKNKKIDVEGKKVKDTVKVSKKETAKGNKTTAKKGIKRALEKKCTPVQSKRIKLEVVTPNAFEIHEPKKTTPKTNKKQLKTPKTAVKVEPVTPVTPIQPNVASIKNTPISTTKKTPVLVSKYKQKTPAGSLKKLQKTPAGSLKKPLKRLTATKSTPAQVKPCDLLKQNLRKQVETAISAKIGNKPCSSPYTLVSNGSNENSPVFTKVESATNKVVKHHITGTPARVTRTRKFGSVIQPSLLEDSVMPNSTQHKVVSSSTPVKSLLSGEDYSTEPHPLESVEATPIRPPCCLAPVSPQPEMVTGGLAKLCAIM